MTRRSLLLGWYGLRVAPAGFRVSGTLTATDQEADEGYFALGQELQLVAKPQSTAHRALRALAGESICLRIEPGTCA